VKAAAIIVLILCLVAAVGVGYLYFTARLTVSVRECVATDAMTQTELFDRLKKQMETGTLIGTPFTTDLPESPEAYQFYSWTLRLENRTFLPADVIEIQITPLEGDVLQIGETAAYRLPARQTMDLSATILTRKDLHNVREITVTYYMWGLPFTEKLSSRQI